MDVLAQPPQEGATGTGGGAQDSTEPPTVSTSIEVPAAPNEIESLGPRCQLHHSKYHCS